MCYSPWGLSSFHALKGFEQNGYFPLNIRRIEKLLCLDTRKRDHTALSERGIVIPDLAPLETYLEVNTGTNSHISSFTCSRTEVVETDFSNLVVSRTLSKCAPVFLQFAGPKLLVPFREFLRHLLDLRDVYNPPFGDSSPDWTPTFHLVLGGALSLKPIITKRKSKLRKYSGNLVTNDAFIEEMEEEKQSTCFFLNFKF